MTPVDVVTHLSPFARAVDLWLSAGWQGIIRLPKREKWPPPEGFTGNDGRWPTDENIDAWRKVPGANVGLRLPRTHVGLDVDMYEPPKAQAFREAQPRLGPLPATYVIRNRSDDPISGTYLYRLPSENCALESVFPGGEVLRYGHRYVILPPSIHPDGREYVLYGPDGLPTDTPPRPDDLPVLP